MNTQPLFWIFGAIALANALSGLLIGRVWNRTRFVTPAEPFRFYPSLLGSIGMVFFVGIYLYVINVDERPAPARTEAESFG